MRAGGRACRRPPDLRALAGGDLGRGAAGAEAVDAALGDRRGGPRRSRPRRCHRWQQGGNAEHRSRCPTDQVGRFDQGGDDREHQQLPGFVPRDPARRERCARHRGHRRGAHRGDDRPQVRHVTLPNLWRASQTTRAPAHRSASVAWSSSAAASSSRIADPSAMTTPTTQRGPLQRLLLAGAVLVVIAGGLWLAGRVTESPQFRRSPTPSMSVSRGPGPPTSRPAPSGPTR